MNAANAASWQGFVVSEKNGIWSRAIKAPGLGTLNTGGLAGVLSVSCASAGSCAAGGYYSESGRGLPSQGFITQDGTRTRRVRSAGPLLRHPGQADPTARA